MAALSPFPVSEKTGHCGKRCPLLSSGGLGIPGLVLVGEAAERVLLYAKRAQRLQPSPSASRFNTRNPFSRK